MAHTLVDEFASATSAVLEPLSVEQYHAMIRQGILVEGAPIELIDGLLIRKDRRDKGGSIMTVGPRHVKTILLLTDLLNGLLDRTVAHVRSQQPVTLDGTSEPEPDLTVVLGKIADFTQHHPGPGVIPLVIEVADSSLSFDRGEKLRKYAAAGIPHYWIANLNDNVIEVYTQPQPELLIYAGQMICRRGDTVSFDMAEQCISLSVDDILA